MNIFDLIDRSCRPTVDRTEATSVKLSGHIQLHSKPPNVRMRIAEPNPT